MIYQKNCLRIEAIRSLINITYFFIFFPYLTLGLPLDSDIQLYSGLFSFLYLMINIKDIKINNTVVFLVGLTVIATSISAFNDGRLSAINTNAEFSSFYKVLVFPYALLIYLFIYNTLDERIIYNLRYFIYAYLFVVFLQYLFPSAYVAIFSNMVRTIKITEMGGIRGVSALTTEPSFTALILFLFILIVRFADIFKNKFEAWLVILLLCFGIFTTKAVTGFGFVALFFIFEAVKRLDIWKLCSIAVLVFLLSFVQVEDYRGLAFLGRLITSPELVLYESSLFYRVYYVVYGFVSLLFNPFGAIIGTVDVYEIKNITDTIFYGHTFPHLFARTVPTINMPSTLAMGLMLYGVLYLFLYLLIFLPSFLNRKTPLIARILIFALTAQSFSFGFPLLWFLIVMSQHDFWKPIGNVNLKVSNAV